MPAHPPVVNTARVVMRFTYLGQLTENVHYVKFSLPVTQSMLDDLASDVADWWGATGRAAFSNQIKLETVHVRDLTAGSALESIEPSGGAGSHGQDPLPGNVSVVTTWLTSQSGKAGRGRTYWAGLVISQVVGNELTAAAQTEINDQATALSAALAGTAPDTPRDHVIVSYVLNGAPRVVPLTSVVTGHRTNTQLDSQRRRLIPGH